MLNVILFTHIAEETAFLIQVRNLTILKRLRWFQFEQKSDRMQPWSMDASQFIPEWFRPSALTDKCCSFTDHWKRQLGSMAAVWSSLTKIKTKMPRTENSDFVNQNNIKPVKTNETVAKNVQLKNNWKVWKLKLRIKNATRAILFLSKICNFGAQFVLFLRVNVKYCTWR